MKLFSFPLVHKILILIGISVNRPDTRTGFHASLMSERIACSVKRSIKSLRITVHYQSRVRSHFLARFSCIHDYRAIKVIINYLSFLINGLEGLPIIWLLAILNMIEKKVTHRLFLYLYWNRCASRLIFLQFNDIPIFSTLGDISKICTCKPTFC